jgi:D-alanyl-D-alanine carboxypeptidase
MAYLNLRRVLAHWRALLAGAAAILAFMALSAFPAEARRHHGFHRHAIHGYSYHHRVVFYRRVARHA